MKRVGDDLRLEAMRQHEDYVHEAADAIETKASQTIAAGAFLAVQPAALLIWDKTPVLAIIIQLIGFGAVCAAVWYSHRVLKITPYPAPGFPEDWCEELVKERPSQTTEEIRETMLWGLTLQAQERIDAGVKENERRIALLEEARGWTNIAFCLNIAALAVTLVMRLF